MKDKTKYSIASKNRWKHIDPEERTKRMSLVSSARWSKMSKEDRREHAMKLVHARNLKKYATK